MQGGAHGCGTAHTGAHGCGTAHTGAHGTAGAYVYISGKSICLTHTAHQVDRSQRYRVHTYGQFKHIQFFFFSYKKKKVCFFF